MAITANANYVIFEGSKELYSAWSVAVNFRYHAVNDNFECEITPVTVSASGTNPEGGHFVLFTKASVDAKTGTGTNPSDKLKNQIDQVVADYLDALTENAAVTFTVT